MKPAPVTRGGKSIGSAWRAGLLAALITASLPARDRNLAFGFQDGFREIVAYLPGKSEPLFDFALTPQGYARIDSSGALLLDRGRFLATGQGRSLQARIRSSGEFSVAATLSPLAPADGTIVGLGSRDDPLFEMSQRSGEWVFRSGAQRVSAALAGESSQSARVHLAAVRSPREMRLYLNGERVASRPLDRLEPNPGTVEDLLIGSGTPDGSGWKGQVHELSVFDRALDDEEVARQAQQARKGLRPPVESITVKARLIGKSHLPGIDEIAPYRESLSVFEYRVGQVLQGEYRLKRIRVAHWLMLDANLLPYANLPLDSVVDLVLERFEENRQLETVNLSDTLEPDFDTPLFFDSGSASLLLTISAKRP